MPPTAADDRPTGRPLARLAATLGLGVLLVPALSPGQPPRPAPNLPPAPTGPNLIAFPAGQPPGKNGDKADPRPVLSLAECVAIALERQPALRAARESQQASLAGQRGLNNIGRVGQAVSPDLEVRKEQAARGQIAVAADIQKVHNEVVYDVTRLYYTIVYARQQQQIADDIVAQLEVIIKAAKEQLKLPRPGDINQAKIDVMEIGLAKARGLQGRAATGQRQAYAALREVMAVDRNFPFRVQDEGLPLMSVQVPVTAEDVILMALTRRPEMALAAAGVDAFRLEVYAQARIPFRRSVPTLASGSDIHARQIPQGSREENYRPEAIAPEMPVQLVGSKYDRVCRAMAYSQRAEAVYEKARNLIALEAENGFYTLEQAAARVTATRVGYLASQDLKDRVREQFAEPNSPKDQLLQGYVAASQGESDYVEAVFQYILALAALERITAGGLKPAFPGR